MIVSKSERGSPFVGIEVRFVNRKVPSGWEACQPFKRTLRLFLTPAAYQYTEEKLLALGFNGDYANPRLSEAVMSKGIKCDIDNDGKYDNVNLVYEGGGGNKEFAKLGVEEIAKFTARFKSKLQLANGAPEDLPTPLQQAVEDEDPPF